jgi:toxin secretion/phage lysis holin
VTNRSDGAELALGFLYLAVVWLWALASTPAKVLFITIGVDFVLGCLAAVALRQWRWEKFSRGIIRFVFYAGLFTVSIALDQMAAEPMERVLIEAIHYLYLGLIAYEVQSIIAKGRPFGLPSIDIKAAIAEIINRKGGLQ